MKYVPFILVTIFFTSCANNPETRYKKRDGAFFGGAVGYEDFHVKENIYHVSYQGGGGGWSVTGDSRSLVTQFLHKRANELCKEKGYKDYKLIGPELHTAELGKSGGSAIGTAVPGTNLSLYSSVSESNGMPYVASYVECIN